MHKGRAHIALVNNLWHKRGEGLWFVIVSAVVDSAAGDIEG